MEEKELEKFIKEKIDQSKAGLQIERPNFDFKTQWPPLTDSEKVGSLLKTITAMANTIGPNGFIVFGFDYNQKTFKDAKFSDCLLRDESDFQQLLNKHLSHPLDVTIYNFEIDNHQVSVIFIPIAPEPPYFIKNLRSTDKQGNEKNEEQRIFVRKGTKNSYATKYDVDNMYRIRGGGDKRKEFEAEIEIIDFGIVEGMPDPIFELIFLVENTGYKPFAVLSGDVQYNGFKESCGFRNHSWSIGNVDLDNQAIIVQTSTLKEVSMSFKLPQDRKFFDKELYEIKLLINLNGNRKKELLVTSVNVNKAFKKDLIADIRKLPDFI